MDINYKLYAGIFTGTLISPESLSFNFSYKMWYFCGISSMNPSCLLKIIFDDTGNHLSLCSCINFSNLLSFRFVAPEPKQLMEMRSSLSAESRHRVVNQFISTPWPWQWLILKKKNDLNVNDYIAGESDADWLDLFACCWLTPPQPFELSMNRKRTLM